MTEVTSVFLPGKIWEIYGIVSTRKSLLFQCLVKSPRLSYWSVGMIIPNIWKNKFMFQTTNQFMVVSVLSHILSSGKGRLRISQVQHISVAGQRGHGALQDLAAEAAAPKLTVELAMEIPRKITAFLVQFPWTISIFFWKSDHHHMCFP